MSNILISYRRHDSADVTGRIYDRLMEEFGRDGVFLDVDSIPLGLDFRTYLDKQVAKCDVFLAVIGRDWTGKSGTMGKSRLEDSTDFVRIEIESALQRQIPVIPVLVRGASIPKEDQLPVSMKELAYRNGISVRPDPDFHNDMDRLVEHLKSFTRPPQPSFPEETTISRAPSIKRAQIVKLLGVVAIFILLGGIIYATQLGGFGVGADKANDSALNAFGKWDASNSRFRSQINIVKLQKYRSKFSLLIICRKKVSTIGLYFDKEIQKSNVYKIPEDGNVLPTSVEFEPKFAEALTPGQKIQCVACLLPEGVSRGEINNVDYLLDKGGIEVGVAAAGVKSTSRKDFKKESR